MRPVLARTTRISPAVLVLTAGTALGGPEGERVVAGQASFDRVGTTTTITAGRDAIIEYGSFDIGVGESVRFVQPSADARVLNRVLGSSPTRIDGSLTANGRVYLVNEAGIYFGDSAVVSAGAIYAAAGTLTDDAFLSGIDRMTGLSGEVRNDGSIRAGEIHFAGRRVTNLGDLDAGDGIVTMTAGDEVFVGRRDGHVFVRADGLGGEGSVDQGGTISAGRMKLGSGDLFSVALRPTSSIRGDDVRVESSGRGTVHVRGEIDVSSSDGVGGLVGVTGEGVAVVGANIDASGALGGGDIFIGGGYRGDTSVIQTADRVYVGADTTLRADALRSGNGGTVVTWGDGAAVFEGEVSVRGGAISGDGGRSEVSSPNFVWFEGRVDAGAPAGKRGSFLLDPDNISVTDSVASPGDSLLDDNQIPVTEAPGLDVIISSTALETIGDVDVLLEAVESILIGDIDDGTLSLPQTAGQTVTFVAGELFRVAQGTTITTEGGNLSITGGEGVRLAGLDANGGTISIESDLAINAPGPVRSDGGTVSFTVNGGDRAAFIGGAEAMSLQFNLDEIYLTGNLVGQADLDLTGVTTIGVPNADTGATIGAVLGADTFDLTFDPSVTFQGPGGLRFVGRNIALPAISGLSRLEVTATESLLLTGDIQTDNGGDGLGGNVDLREAATIRLSGDTKINTELDPGEAAGSILLAGAVIDATGSQLTLETGGESSESPGMISIGDATLRRLRLFGGPVSLDGAIDVQDTLGFGFVTGVMVDGETSIATNGATLFFGSTRIDGPGSLAIDLTGAGAPGSLGLGADIGSTDPLESLSITGGGYTLRSVTTTGSQSYTSSSQVRIDGELETTGPGSITFDAGVVLDRDQTITTAGGEDDDILFLGGVNGSGVALTTETGRGAAVFDGAVALGSLTTLGSTELRGTTISTEQDLLLGEDPTRDVVTLTQRESLIRSRTGDVIVRSSVQGGQRLSVAVDPTVTGNNIPVIWFEGSIGSETPLESLVLGAPDAAFFGGTRTDIPEVATVVMARLDDDGNPIAGQSFEIETTGDFVMNPLEKLTALGSISVTAGGTAQIGDMNTPGNLTITAPDILVNTRAEDDLVTINDDLEPPALRPAFATEDSGVDFVVGGSAAFNGVVRLLDSSLPQPSIAEPAGQVRVLNILTRAPQDAVTLDELAFNRRTGAGPELERTTVLDARATGAVTVPLAEGLTPESDEREAVLAQNAALAEPNVPEASASASSVGVGVRAPTAEEYLSSARGAAFYVDMPDRLGGSSGLSVASARLSPSDAEAFTEAWSMLARAVNEPVSEPDAVLGRIRATLSVSAQQYQTLTGESIDDADAFALFASIRDSQADASRGLTLVASLLERVRGLGLSEGETRRIENAILEAIRPESLRRSTVRSLVEAAGDSR